MYLSLHYYFVFVLSFVPGIMAQSRSVTVAPATANLGKDATMTFTFIPEGAESMQYLFWYKSNEAGERNGGPIMSNTNTEPNDKYNLSSNGDLIIYKVTKDDADYYLCSITTSTGNSAEGFSNLRVNYLYHPKLEPKEQSVKENEIATFSCPLPEGVPTPITITWIKDGDVLDVSDTEKYPQSDRTLEINRINEMDEGDYQCRAENAAYSGDEGKLSNTVTLSLDSGGLSTGGKVGISIGCILAVALAAGSIVFCWFNKQLCFSNKT